MAFSLFCKFFICSLYISYVIANPVSSEEDDVEIPEFEWIPDADNDGVRDMKMEFENGSVDFLRLKVSPFAATGDCAYSGELESNGSPVSVTNCEGSERVEIVIPGIGSYYLNDDGETTPIEYDAHTFDIVVDPNTDN